MFDKWHIRKHPNYRSLYYIDSGDGALPATITESELSRKEGAVFRLAASAPDMYHLLSELSEIEHLSPAIKAQVEAIFQWIDAGN